MRSFTPDMKERSEMHETLRTHLGIQFQIVLYSNPLLDFEKSGLASPDLESILPLIKVQSLQTTTTRKRAGARSSWTSQRWPAEPADSLAHCA